MATGDTEHLFDTAGYFRYAETMKTIELIALSGIAGSGKTTWAMAWVAEDPENRIRVNQDDIRKELFGTPDYSREQEKQVKRHYTKLLGENLTAGKSVVSDNTNLRAGKFQHLSGIARRHGAVFRIHRLHVSVEEATSNIARRVMNGGLHVDTNILHTQYEAFLRDKDEVF